MATAAARKKPVARKPVARKQPVSKRATAAVPRLKRPSPAKPARRAGAPAGSHDVRNVLATLESLGSRKEREALERYGIVAPRAFGIRMGVLQALAKQIGRDHALAAALWKSGWYEARLVAAYVDDPARVTVAQMDRWARDFDNWGITDTVCFVLFDRTPHALGRVAAWAPRREEFVRRAAFALLACVALHHEAAPDAAFHTLLPAIERGAADGRNFVKKGVSWALRSVGRRSVALHRESIALAKRLAASDDAASRWVGKDALRDLGKPALTKALAAKAAG